MPSNIEEYLSFVKEVSHGMGELGAKVDAIKETQSKDSLTHSGEHAIILKTLQDTDARLTHLEADRRIGGKILNMVAAPVLSLLFGYTGAHFGKNP